MFRARSTPSPEKFQWSIDNIAILKPVEIDVSSHNPDHSYSPETEAEIQRKADTFFAQKSILPSPWLPEKTAAKHVTFSPRPPQTEYYLDESLVMESSNTHVKEGLGIIGIHMYLTESLISVLTMSWFMYLKLIVYIFK
jgi:hypothetical protein